MKVSSALLFLALGFAVASAQEADNHGEHMQHGALPSDAAPNKEAGQAAFAAIAEIVAILDADPSTNWSRVNIAALRDHLADMDRVTLHAQVAAENIADGAIFTVSGEGDVGQAVKTMMMAHAPVLESETGFTVKAEETGNGARWTVTSSRPADEGRIRGLGFFGLLATGAHHQSHHFAIARGEMMH